MIEFRIGGRKVTARNIGDVIQAAMLESIEADLRSKIGSIRDPETGEFPLVVVSGRSLEELTVKVEGSPQLIEIVEARLGGKDEAEEGSIVDAEQPVAFLCHGFEDKQLVRQLARDLRANGVDVFFDEWEIRAGDSLRQKIDEGLMRCTHFIAVLSPVSIGKPWVQAEMDAAFIRKVGGLTRFIALRSQLAVEKLPPLLSGSMSPSIDDYDVASAQLISDILGVTRKPPLGQPPAVKSMATAGASVSPAAEAVCRLLVDRSEHGDSRDPEIEGDELRRVTGLSDDDLVDAVDELCGLSYVGKEVHAGCGAIGFGSIYAKSELFVAFDPTCRPWIPSDDAVVLATKTMEAKGQWLAVAGMAAELNWKPRRMNPALHFLINRELVGYSEACGSYPWATNSIDGKAATRRWLRSKS